MKKRIISLLLVLTFILPMIPTLGITASATSDVASIESEAVITVEEIWGNPGKTVDLDFILTENPGILGATITISWDESLTLIADASGEAFDHMTYTSPSRYVASGTNFVWFGNEVDEAIDGTILTLTFQVSETAQNNDILPVRVTYTLGDVIDENDNDVILNITDGSVRVITYQPGDVTGDGRVNARDLVRLSQYISDGCKTDPEGYNAKVVEDACDVTEDGRVNARDLIKLSQYISDGSQTNPDGYNAVLKPAKMPECAHSNVQETPAKAAECTEPGNIAYWYCSDCGKYFRDAECTAEISLSNTVIEATGHTYSLEWTNDTTHHWHKATCEHSDLISEKISHSLDADKNCSVCGYDSITIIQLATPIISNIEYDTIYWTPVEGAEYYTVRVNDNYECTLRGTECDLTDVKNNGSSISKFGYIRVEVRANGYISEDGDVIDNIMTVYPVMAGKDVHKIVIVGAFDEAESRNLIDKFSITLSKKWNRNVDIVIENLGVVAASDAGIVDTSAIRNNIKVNVDYSGINIIKQTNEEYQLFAKINSKIYSFVFDTQDTNYIESIQDGIDLSSARIESGTLYLPQCFKANYEFGGWYDANGLQVADSTGKLNLSYADTFNEVRVNAKWNPITYKITLNNYSATSAGTKEIFELYNVGFYLDYEGNQNIVKIPELPQRTGFVFKGYYAGVTDNATANAKSNGTQYIDESGNILVTWAEFSSNTVIYALWVPDIYTITLDNQGAKTPGSAAYYEKYVSGVYLDKNCATTGKITVPTKDGYTFMGYYESVSDNGTAAAKGTGLMIKPDGTIVASNKQYTANKTLYALWTEPRYEISFDNQGANVSGSTSIYQKTGVGFYQDVNCTTIVPSNKIAVPKKTGYTFGGYYVAVSNNNTPSPTGTTQYVKADGTILVTNTAFTGNKTLYALWDLDEFKVMWNTIANCSITVTRKSSQWSGAKIGELSSGDTIYYGDKLVVTYTANTGYHFEVNGSNPTSITSEFVVTQALTANDITVKPIINTYTVVYNGNGNTGGSMSNVAHTYGTAKNLTANSFSRHGWTFTGWKDQNGKTYTNGQQVNNLTTKHGDTITLYAQWALITTNDYVFSTFEVNNGIGGANGKYITLTDIFDMETLRNQGYTLHVSMNFTLKDVDAGSDGKYIFGFRVYNGTADTSPKLYDTGTADVSSGSRPKSYNSVVNVSCNSLSNNNIGFLFVEDTYALFGVVTNRYNVEGLVMTIYFTR